MAVVAPQHRIGLVTSNHGDGPDPVRRRSTFSSMSLEVRCGIAYDWRYIMGGTAAHNELPARCPQSRSLVAANTSSYQNIVQEID